MIQNHGACRIELPEEALELDTGRSAVYRAEPPVEGGRAVVQQRGALVQIDPASLPRPKPI